MSTGEPEETSVVTGFADVVEKLHNLELDQQYQSNFHQLLSDGWNNVESLCHGIDDLPAKIAEEMHLLAEARVVIASERKSLEQKLVDVRQENSLRAEKHAAILEARDKEYQAKVTELETLHEQCAHYRGVLKQKKASVASVHQQMQAESGEVAKQNEVMKRLTAKLGAKKSKFSKDQEELKSRSDELSKVFIDRQDEIKNLRSEISTKTKALEAVRAENSLKVAELDALRSRTEDIRAVTDRKKQQNLEIISEFEAVEKERKDEIDRIEGQIAEESAKYAMLAEQHTDLTNRITSEFGNSKSLKEIKAQALSDLWTLDLQHSRLNETVDEISKSMQTSGKKLAELNKAKEDIFRLLNMKATETLEGDERRLRKRSDGGDLVCKDQRSETKGPTFAVPLAMPVNRRHQQQQQQLSEVDVPENQNNRVVRRADSSVSEDGCSTFAKSSAVGVTDQAREDFAKLDLFRRHFIQNNTVDETNHDVK